VACKGNLNIRIHRDITGEMWFGVEQILLNKAISEKQIYHLMVYMSVWYEIM